MNSKKNIRYFVGEGNESQLDLNQLMGSSHDLPKRMTKSEKVVKDWKNTSKVKKQFLNNEFVSEELIHKYDRRMKMNISSATKHKKFKKRLLNDEKKKQNSIGFTARSELLLPEMSGYLEPEDNEQTYQISQKEITESVDITSATKHFDLNLQELGHYFINYYRNGRNLLLGGRRGHIAAMDWLTKELICEFNVQESVHDIHWLHMPTMFAVSQKDWVYIYDNKGIQIHCLKKMYRIVKLDFLYYHFLLVSASDNGFLSWLDISMGDMVSSLKMKVPRLTAMKQNPYNAIIATGHPNGTVDMWSPNQKESVASMLCHPSAIRDIAFNCDGVYMVSAGVDRTMKVWDIRNFKCLQSYKLRSVPTHLDISQRNSVAVSVGNVVEVYNDCFTNRVNRPYMRHRLDANVSDLEFCNFEDVLGIGNQKGFTSIIIPGSGEPNFDAFESNPYMSRTQRREMEVKALLDKIPAELISLEPTILGSVDKSSLKKQIEDKKNIRYLKPQTIELESKPKKKRQKSAKKVKVKKGLNEVKKRKQIKESVKQKTIKKIEIKKQKIKIKDKTHVLDRFVSKT